MPTDKLKRYCINQSNLDNIKSKINNKADYFGVKQLDPYRLNRNLQNKNNEQIDKIKSLANHVSNIQSQRQKISRIGYVPEDKK